MAMKQTVVRCLWGKSKLPYDPYSKKHRRVKLNWFENVFIYRNALGEPDYQREGTFTKLMLKLACGVLMLGGVAHAHCNWKAPKRGYDDLRETRGRRVVVVGAGVVGLTTAWHLSRRGFDVTVVDAGAEAGSGATGQSGGIFARERRLPTWEALLPQPEHEKWVLWYKYYDAGIWFDREWYRFLVQSIPATFFLLMKWQYATGLNASQQVYDELLERAIREWDAMIAAVPHLRQCDRPGGWLRYYRDPSAFEAARRKVMDLTAEKRISVPKIINGQVVDKGTMTKEEFKFAFGDLLGDDGREDWQREWDEATPRPDMSRGQQVLGTQETLDFDPRLTGVEHVVGSVYCPMERWAHPRDTCAILERVCRLMPRPVKFQYNTKVMDFRFEEGDDKASAECMINERGDKVESLHADTFVLCCGHHAAPLARSVGASLPLMPLRGYCTSFLSETVGGRGAADACSGPYLWDVDLHAGCGRYGWQDEVRVSGGSHVVATDAPMAMSKPAGGFVMANFFGGDGLLWFLGDTGMAKLGAASIQGSYRKYTRTLFPQLGYFNDLDVQGGDRAMTPDWSPVVGPLRGNVWVNTGHGTAGWTLAWSCAPLIADAMTGVAPALDLSALSPLRFDPATRLRALVGLRQPGLPPPPLRAEREKEPAPDVAVRA